MVGGWVDGSRTVRCHVMLRNQYVRMQHPTPAVVAWIWLSCRCSGHRSVVVGGGGCVCCCCCCCCCCAVWCGAERTLVVGGLLFLSVPVGPDVVVWNLHRRYGGWVDCCYRWCCRCVVPTGMCALFTVMVTVTVRLCLASS